jgi:glycine/D-amino acid oxidase-like deaminating enzyme
MTRPRVLIVGGGTMGLAAAWAFARRGVAVELFERHGHVHEHGSHSGHTRAIRHAYHEGSDYVGLVVRADQEWTALGQRVGEQLLVRCGLLEFGPPDQPDFMAACQALRDHQIRHELLDADATRARYGFRIPSDWPACLAPDSGYLRVRPCLDALRREAEAHGAVLHHHVGVRELICGGPRPGVQLDDGTRVDADHVVVAAGAWAAELLGLAQNPASPGGPRALGGGEAQNQFAASPLRVLRRVLAWTIAEPSVRARLRALPVWATFVPEGFVYGFPDNDEGISGFKLACHASEDPSMNEPVDPRNVERTVGERDLAPLRAFIARYLPEAGEISATATCLYTNTETGDFWIDRHGGDPRVTIAAGFSGHGFKFAPAIGLALAELTLDGESELALARFRRPAIMTSMRTH